MLHIDHYSLVEELHRGEREALYRGHRTADRAPVLIKVLLDGHPGPRAIARLRHEHAIAEGLTCAAIARPLELAPQGHGLALVLHDPGGAPLSALLHAGQLDLGERLRILAGAARALELLHDAGVIHKGVRPANLLVDPATGQVLLLGLGFATRLAQETQQLTSPDALEGTLAYLSPEQTGRMNRPIDSRSDLYSLGVTAYETLTGVLPFQATDPVELMYGHLARTPVPPHRVAPDVPVVVSDLVMRLLAKTAEERYQRAGGVAEDLEACADAWAARGEVAPFPLGGHDHAGLRIPQRLYGREEELGDLARAWARASQGSAELLLVSGPPGIGKSVLVGEIHKDIARARGYFITGKFDQLDRAVPYASLAEAFRGLVRQLLTERADALARWRDKLLAAVGANGRVLTDVLPELTLILGPQPEAQELAPAAAQSRFTLLFQDFLRVFATAEHPLAIFLDDLQWVDLASLELLQHLVTAPDARFLLVIGAYRSNEIDDAHALIKTLSQIDAAGVQVSEIGLGPLDAGGVTRFVADALGCDPPAAAPLAEVVFEKTRGNPFFLGQFLTALHRDGLLEPGPEAGAWRWDLDRIRRQMATDNVIVFLTERLLRLPAGTQRALQLAACIGHRFDLKTLSVVCESPRAAVAAALWDALAEGIVVPLDPDYRFVHAGAASLTSEVASEVAPDSTLESMMDSTLESMPDPTPASAPASTPAPVHEFDVSYRFLHDRVQQAAYSLIGEDQKAAVHLRIGRLMLARAGGAPGDDLFEVLAHMNVGAPLLDDPAERLGLSRLNLAAGTRAGASTAYHAAASYLAIGTSLLGPGSWDDEYALAFALHLERARCEALAGRNDQAESLHAILIERARTALERSEVQRLRMVLYSAAGRPIEAMEAGFAGLRLLGIEPFDTDEAWEAARDAELAEVQVNLAGRRVQEIINAPLITDPALLAAIRLLMDLGSPSFGLKPSVLAWSTVKPINLTLKHGNSELAAQAFATYGMLLTVYFGRYTKAYEFARLALALHERFPSANETCKINFLFVGVAHHAAHWRSLLPHLERGYCAGIESADLLHLSYSCTHILIARLALGDPLRAVREEGDRFTPLLQRANVASSKATLALSLQMIANLEGRTRSRSTLSDDRFDEAALVASIEGARLTFPLCWYYTLKGELAFLYEDHENAIAMLIRARELPAINFTPEIRYYASLAILALGPTAIEVEQRQREAMLASCMQELAMWARACKENYLHKHLLVEAEHARASGEDDRAMGLYEQAIAAAQENGWTRDVALASELCAKFHLRRGSARIARAFMTDAAYAYAQWGATAKVEQLAETYPALVPIEVQGPVSAPLSRRASDRLDTATVIRCLHAISGELVLDHVLDRLMRIVAQNAGAQRGFLILERGGRLVIEAAITAEMDNVAVRLATPVEESSELAATVVQYVARVREPVVLGEATQAVRFAGDPYIVLRRPRSIACLAMIHQGRLKGVLYLENNAASDAFTADRIELLSLLSSQAAMSVENAMLYARQQETAEELSLANKQLRREIVDREQAAQERSRLAYEVREAQAARLAELSTPLIPITAEIVVMPLIGTMDAERALRMLEVAVDGAHLRGAKVVILDITGVKTVDAEVASTLERTASALGLLGAEAVITGVGPEVAQTLVALGAGFGATVTRSSLQSGIAYGLERTGQRWVRSGRRAPGRSGRQRS